MMPAEPPAVLRDGVWLGMRYTPLDSAGLYFPGGKASYPSTLIMLAVPAQVAGVKRIVVCSPPSRYGRSDLVLAACHELGLTEFSVPAGRRRSRQWRLAPTTIPASTKSSGREPLRSIGQTRAGRLRGIDGFLGPSEILVIADETAIRVRSRPT